jgi:hypothetical protein
MKKIFAILSFALAMALFSCKKDEKPIQDLIAGQWSLESLYRNSDKIAGNDTEYMLHLRKDGTYRKIEVNGNLDEGSWALVQDDKGLELKGQSETQTYIIGPLTGTNLELKLIQDPGKEGAAEFRYYLVRFTQN